MSSPTSDGFRGGGEGGVRVCPDCGTRCEPAQSFCETCGAVLRWSAPDASEGPSASGVADSEFGAKGVGGVAGGPTPLADRGSPARSQVAGSMDDGEGSARAVPGPAAWSNTPAGGAGSPANPAAGQSDPAGPDGGADPAATTESLPAASAEPPIQEQPFPDADAERARALLVPVAAPEERPPEVPAVRPGTPAATRPHVQGPTPTDAEGGLACPWCGTANHPDRHFCDRCAMSMARSPQQPVRPSWWRRLLDRWRREVPWAGDRPRLRRDLVRILKWIVACAAAVGVFIGLLHTGDAVQAVRDHFTTRAPVHPDTFNASRSYPKHGPQLAFDMTNDTWWGPGVSQSGAGEWIEARFQEPVHLLDIGITPGRSSHAKTLHKSAMPHRLDAVVTTDSGRTYTKHLTLDQGAGFQKRELRAKNVSTVRLRLKSAYGTAADKQVAIAEVEFFGPSHSDD